MGDGTNFHWVFKQEKELFDEMKAICPELTTEKFVEWSRKIVRLAHLKVHNYDKVRLNQERSMQGMKGSLFQQRERSRKSKLKNKDISLEAGKMPIQSNSVSIPDNLQVKE